MKVRDVMQTSVISVEEDLLVKNVARIIFTGNVYNFPVVKGKKLVGFLTEEDIFLGMRDVSKKNEYDKEGLLQILEKSVRDLMVKNVISVTPDTPLPEAQHLMYEHNFAQLPVIDEKGDLVGIVTRANIFRHVLEEQIPKLEGTQYSAFIGESYDQMVDWEKRFEYEFPSLLRVFSKNKVKKVLELGSWTGEYSIALAKEGLQVTGIDNSPLMVSLGESKKAKLSKDIQDNASFVMSDFSDISELFKASSFDGAICMGGGFPYLPGDPKKVLSDLKKIIKPDGVVVLQLINLERIVENKGRFYYFKIKKSNEPNEEEELFIEFFDKKSEKTLVHNVIHFTSDGTRWLYKGINSIEIKYLKNNEIEQMVKDAGFKDLIISGNKGEYRGEYGQMSLVKPFDSQTSDWMTVIAKA